LSYNFTKDFFGSFDYFYLYGGETKLDGTRQKDWVDTHTLGLTFAYMLNPPTQLMINGKTDAGVFNGIRTSSFGVRLGFIF
jgi:cbb3-type cytochrome oxidase subunit 1